MEHYNAGVPGCAVTAHAVDTLQTLARMLAAGCAFRLPP